MKTIVKMMATTEERGKTIVKTNPIYKESARAIAKKGSATKSKLPRI
jgi:ABC-type amino acid transport substrate-binding protein